MKQAIEILQRRKWLFIVPFTIVFLVPVLWSLLFMRSYESSSVVWLDSDVSIASVLGEPTAVQTGVRPIQQEADTLQQLLETRTFLTGVIAGTPLQSKMDTPRRRNKTIAFVRKNLRTEVIGPNALTISFYGRSPEEAAIVARVTTSEFLEWVKRAASEQDEQSTAFFSTQSEAYREELETARAELQAYKEKHPETSQLDIADKVLSAPDITASPAVQSEFGRLKSQAQYAQELYDSSLSDLAKTRALSAAAEERYVNGLRVVDEPIEPTTFSRKRLLLFDFLALLAATLVGATVVIFAELTDRTLRSERDVEDVLDLQVLSEVRQSPHDARQA